MKKILIVLAILFIIGVGCKKTLDPGGGLCACSPVETSVLGLVIKNSTELDLLDTKTAGYFDKTKIQLYTKGANNVIKQIGFEIRQPFSYGTGLKLDYYQLFSYEITLQSKSIEDTFYLKLGDKLYELNLKVNNNVVEKLLIDKVESPKELPSARESYLGSIYTLKV